MAVQGEEEDIWLDFSLGLDGFAEVTAVTTPLDDRRKVRVRVPPGKLIPIVFLPGIMGSNLRLSRERQELLKRSDNLAWWPDKKGDAFSRRNASAAARQMRLDPDEVEVDRYNVTDEKIEGKKRRRFDATGDTTISSDKRHDNVPDDLGDISKLLITDPKADPTHPLASNRQCFTAAQKARARGWSEVMFDAYGSILQSMERLLNDMLRREENKLVVSPAWVDKSNPEALIGRSPSSFGVHDAQPLSEDDIRRIGNCWYPVHAFGYNWLRSNGEEGKQLAKKIELLIDTYNHNGFDCLGVILVTHSMGGILARAMMHADYGDIRHRILGVVHGVMPTTGAAAAYKRMRAGFEGSNKPWWHLKARLIGGITQGVLGDNGEEVTAVLANAQGGLELLPAAAYGTQWLQVQDDNGKFLAKWPSSDAVSEIYTLDRDKWWRLINPDWIDPAGQAGKPKEEGGKPTEQIGLEATTTRIEDAMRFADSIRDTFHPRTYAHYGSDPGQPAWNDLVWRVVNGDPVIAGDPLTWPLLPGHEGDNGEGLLRVKGDRGEVLKLKLQPPMTPSDGTVPVERSAAKVRAKAKFVQAGYDHQGSYSDANASAATLYGIVRIAADFDTQWWSEKN
ncbi:esterase/lipase family protein [Variovorax sp. tm]|uniref:esterase/lipase family protein n=1 Tax=Variovorax atrisoli TaxID=3394203 RepID=UPI003A80B653